NLTAGGSGKTPLALALHDLLREDIPARATFFLTRGYGGAQSGPLRVDPARHDFRAVGDEALLLARRAPTIVARDRVAGAALARENGAGLLILDDGFQSRALARDLQILVIDGAAGLGNGRLLPAGPLREPPAPAFARADAVVIVGPDARGVRTLLPAGKPVFEAFVKPVRAPDPAHRWIAFAGLGRPGKFRETLEDMGIRPLQFMPFPDHHPYTDRDPVGGVLTVDPGLPAGVRELLARACSPRFEDRFRSAQDFIQALVALGVDEVPMPLPPLNVTER
ncbi:MAG TPA: tetraacyldisaccharide 4'-kinase, partial [Alphaproteobacteria bacterium]|nr:tetraacyldisaccharide 4'-kinase [Alphaproteobacteria bacterium]